MSATPGNESELQRHYYAETAANYDAMHVDPRDEHSLALGLMMGTLDFIGVRSILDVGSGTGRAIRQIKRARRDIAVRGIEPVDELRRVAYANGVSEDELGPGDALALPFPDGAFDLVCAFGVLHHVKTPGRAVAEMLRVARKAVFISDANNFGQGRVVARGVKQILHACGLWPLADFIKTRGRGYTVSEGDGLAYSYSVFEAHAQLRRHCRSVHVMNTTPGGVNPYRTASHAALLGIKP